MVDFFCFWIFFFTLASACITENKPAAVLIQSVSLGYTHTHTHTIQTATVPPIGTSAWVSGCFRNCVWFACHQHLRFLCLHLNKVTIFCISRLLHVIWRELTGKICSAHNGSKGCTVHLDEGPGKAFRHPANMGEREVIVVTSRVSINHPTFRNNRGQDVSHQAVLEKSMIKRRIPQRVYRPQDAGLTWCLHRRSVGLEDMLAEWKRVKDETIKERWHSSGQEGEQTVTRSRCLLMDMHAWQPSK